jgi:hypothetical protein
MKRGFMLTAITVVLFMLLIDTALQYSKNSSAYSKRISEMIVSNKVTYTFDDINQDVTSIFGVSITQKAPYLLIQDSMPASNITTSLGLYEDFVRNYYLPPEIEVKFLNSNEQPITLNKLSASIFVSPFNLNYGYDNFSKNNLLIQIPASQVGAIPNVWYNLTVTSGNFFIPPDTITWGTLPAGCCVILGVTIYDGAAVVPYNYSGIFNPTNSPPGYLNLSFVDENCSMEIQIGSQYLLNLTNHGCNISSQISFSLNDSNTRIYLPEKISVRDVNYNTSKKDNINLVVKKLMG